MTSKNRIDFKDLADELSPRDAATLLLVLELLILAVLGSGLL